MPVNKKAKELYHKVFDGIETISANTIQIVQMKRMLDKNKPSSNIPREYYNSFRDYWAKYGNYSPMWGWFYAARNGIEDVRYIPSTLYYTKIDQYYNNRKLGWGFNDKNNYSMIFPNVKQPKVLVRKIGNLIFDSEYRCVSVKNAMKILVAENEVIVKPTQDSGSGRGIRFISTSGKQLYSILCNRNEKDIIIQSIVKQNKVLAEIYPKSLNTIRVTTLLLEDGVHVLSAILRMGINGSRLDNASAGGLSVGIDEAGNLNKYAYSLFKGEKFIKHPDGYVFEGTIVPKYCELIECVKEMAQRIGHFRLVAWDMAIDDKDEVVLIEANMRMGGIESHQFNNGPLFGDLTERVLNEVFSK